MKQQLIPFGAEYPADIPEEIRETFIRDFEEWEVEKQRQMDLENTALLSDVEKEQINTAVESIADKLVTIDTLLQARNRRIARILTAACDQTGQSAQKD